MKAKYRRKKGPVQSKKISYNGIDFASGLERYMYIALKKSKIPAVYEGQTMKYFLDLIFLIFLMKDVVTEKVSIKIEVIKKYLILNIHLILQVKVL